MESERIDGSLFIKMIRGGIDNLSLHADEVNDLNVFPIPDGDTGSNMLLTLQGGETDCENKEIGKVSRKTANGMLLSARGNSGVILSQFYDGIADGLADKDYADAEEIADAFLCGVNSAYSAVAEPTEGTILTVMREASNYAKEKRHENVNDYLSDFLFKAKETLEATPDMLAVLKKTGVVDSGGAGLIYIIEGARRAS